MITASLSLKLLVRISLMLEGLVIDLEHVLDIRVYVVSVNVSVLIVAHGTAKKNLCGCC
jgi:hypothetical protein